MAPNTLKERHTKRKTILIGGGVTAATVVLAVVAVLFVRSNAPELVPISCSQAMPVQQAQKIWNENQQTVQDIRAIRDSAGQVTVRLDTTRCTGRAFLDVLFDTADGRRKVQQLLERSPLKLLPVEWHNA